MDFFFSESIRTCFITAAILLASIQTLLQIKFVRLGQFFQSRFGNIHPLAGQYIFEKEYDSAFGFECNLIAALQESVEMYLTPFLEDAYCCTLQRGRVTMIPKDMHLVSFLRRR